TLAQAIRRMLGVPNNGNINITNLPGQLPDDQPALYFPPVLPSGTPLPPPPPPRFDQLNVLPRITAPPAATAAFRAQVALYNQHGKPEHERQQQHRRPIRRPRPPTL